MAGSIVMTKDLLAKIAEEAANRTGGSNGDGECLLIRAERILEKTDPEELIVRGVVASLKRGEGKR